MNVLDVSPSLGEVEKVSASSLIAYLEDMNKNGGPQPPQYPELQKKFIDFDSGNPTPDEVARILTFMRTLCQGELSGSVVARSLLKPEGYPGGGMIMEAIYQYHNNGGVDSSPIGGQSAIDNIVGVDGKAIFSKRTSMARAWDAFFMWNEGAQAVNARMEFAIQKINDTIKGANGRIVNLLEIGGGPMYPYDLALRRLEQEGMPLDNVRIDAWDTDANIRQFALGRLGGFGLAGLNYTDLDIKKLLGKESEGIFDKSYDYIGVFGLMDYFKRKICGRMTENIYKGLTSQGKAFIGNFMPNPSDPFMRIGLNWTLFLSKPDDMKRDWTPSACNTSQVVELVGTQAILILDR